MLLFAHTGITFGLAMGIDVAFRKGASLYGNGLESEGANGTSRLAAIGRSIDYRLVLVGSMLPDIIDKPFGHYFLGNGRVYAHTLLFFLILFGIGLFRLWRGGKTGILVMALCSGGHLIMDGMWRTPQTLFWPLYGWSFPKSHIDWWPWILRLIEGLETNPRVYIPEIIGMVILVPFGLELLRSGNLVRFLKSGVFKWKTTTS